MYFLLPSRGNTLSGPFSTQNKVVRFKNFINQHQKIFDFKFQKREEDLCFLIVWKSTIFQIVLKTNITIQKTWTSIFYCLQNGLVKVWVDTEIIVLVFAVVHFKIETYNWRKDFRIDLKFWFCWISCCDLELITYFDIGSSEMSKPCTVSNTSSSKLGKFIHSPRWPVLHNSHRAFPHFITISKFSTAFAFSSNSSWNHHHVKFYIKLFNKKISL